MRYVEGGVKFALGSDDELDHWQREYCRMIDAAMREQRSSELTSGDEQSTFFGSAVPRNDVLYKVRGRAKYLDSIQPEQCIYARFVRSEYPHARIKRVDTSRARALAGVKGVLTAEDIPDDQLFVGTLEKDTPILAKDRVRFVGEPIVAVAADSLAVAEAACRLVDIEYESLKPVLSPQEALAQDAPLVDPGGNVIADFKRELGDVSEGFANSDVVVERTFTAEAVDHCFLEGQGAIAFVDPEGILTLLASTQYPHYHQRELPRVTGLPEEKIRVVQTVVGGAFGGKIDVTVECVACLFALKLGRPVKMTLTREEVFVATTKRHRMEIHQKLGARNDGRLVACDIRILADGGAYRSYSLIVAGRVVVHSGMPYEIPNLRVNLTTTFTNHPPAGAMRSFGVIKGSFANESLLNEIASKLGISPIQIRRINGFKEGSKTSTGQVLKDVGLLKTLDAIEPIYEQCRREHARDNKIGPKRGLGVASLAYGIGYTGVPNPAVFTMSANTEGLVTAFCGTPDIGTGSDTTFAQIIADSAGLDLGRIRIVTGDSARSQDAGPTSASRLTYFCGNAGYICGQDFKNKFEAAFAAKREIARELVRLAHDEVAAGNERFRFDDACQILSESVATVVGLGRFDPEAGVDLETFTGNPYPTYTYGTHLVEVEVDEELGTVKVLRYWAAHDAGKIVNPVSAEGQVEGGVAMGLGMALWEKVARQDGHTLNPNYRDYLLPGTKDVAPNMTTIFVSNTERTGPFGAKGFAESSLIPAPAVVAAAIYEAVGVRPTRLPMESQYILDLIQSKRAGHPRAD